MRRLLFLLMVAVHWPRVVEGWRASRVLQVRRELREMIARCDAMLNMRWYQVRRPW